MKGPGPASWAGRPAAALTREQASLAAQACKAQDMGWPCMRVRQEVGNTLPCRSADRFDWFLAWLACWSPPPLAYI